MLEGKKARALPLRFADGAVFLGPLNVGQMPPLLKLPRRVDLQSNDERHGAAYSAFLPNGACGRPKSGTAESWPISTIPRRIARVRLKCSNNASPSPRRIARVSLERSSLKVPSISSTASLLARNTSRHMIGSEAAIRVKSRKPPAENFITSDEVTCPSSSAVLTIVQAIRCGMWLVI